MTFRDELKWIRRHGIRAWLTWATVEEACELVPVRRSARFWRWVFRMREGRPPSSGQVEGDTK